MYQRTQTHFKTWNILFLSLFTAGLLTSCTQKYQPITEADTKETQITINNSKADNSQSNPLPNKETTTDSTTIPDISSTSPQEEPIAASKAADMTTRFGDGSITGQTFEVQLSQYNDKVYFVPFSPSDNQDFHMQIIQHDKVLADIPAYVPANLSDETFTSLDAVSFYDVNYDGNTDIMLIVTYGNTTFAAVYYGFDSHAEDFEPYFQIQEHLSDNITLQVPPLSISQIRIFLSGGKRNGEFSDYKEAYQAVARLWKLSNPDEIKYSLIYIDDDDIPELTAGLNGYYTSLYTYQDGKVYTLMDRWAYGAMGNAGYEYSPRKNSIRNTNTDYAGAILYTTYLSVSNHQSLDTIAEIKFYNFDDANKNGIPDEDEMDSMGMYGVSYLNGSEATDQQCASYDMGGYQFITGTMTLEDLLSALK